MAKQRRDRPRPATSQTRSPSRDSDARTASEADTPDPAATERRHRHVQAVALYEQAVQALQNRSYAEASARLRAVLDDFPDESDLHERVRLYLKICERQVTPAEATPRSVQERLYAATLALNAGAIDVALAHLQTVLREEANNDHALYMQALAYISRNELEAAALSLQQAIALNPENLGLARREPDFEALRQHPEISRMLDFDAEGRRSARQHRAN
jgi:tetratricopeptide (TPR) repeat protein